MFFQQEKEGREEEIEREEMGVLDPFLKDPNLDKETRDVNEDEETKVMDSMDVQVGSVQNAPLPPSSLE